MEVNKILTADVLDIIFEGRNKIYGAYELRKTYNRRILIALTGILILALAFTIASVIKKGDEAYRPMLVKDIDISDVPKEEIKPDPVIIPPKTQPERMEITRFTPPLIVKEADVKPEDEIKKQDELENTQIGTINQAGIKSDVVAPPVETMGTGKVVALAEKNDYDGEFITVQVEAKFPGDWGKFLERTLNAEVPQDNGAPAGAYSVTVSFLVDKEGNVSEVQALNDPGFGTAAEAVRAIKKGPKWIPAEQNGNKVIYRQKQNIVFRVQEG